MPRERGIESTGTVLPGTAIMEHEHLIIHRVVAAMVRLIDELDHGSEPDTEILEGLVSFLQVFADQCHHTKEDRWLFPLLEARGVPPSGCPVGALEDEHKQARVLGNRLAEAVAQLKSQGFTAAKESLTRALRELVALYPGHLWKEDYLLLPMADKLLSHEDQEKLVKDFDGVEAGIQAGLHEQLEVFPAALERAVGRMVEARGAGVAPLRTPAPTGSPVLEFSIEEHIKKLKLERNWQAGRNSETIVKYPDFRVILTVLRAGSRLSEHHADGPISVHVVQGHIQMDANGRAVDLPAGSVLALGRAVLHDVEAKEDSAFLLTIAWPASGPRHRP